VRVQLRLRKRLDVMPGVRRVVERIRLALGAIIPSPAAPAACKPRSGQPL
jgi:hypothetical protein